MSKVFVIPDVHLKPWMFDQAAELIDKGSYDAIVCLGDLVDDWDQQSNIELYKNTFRTAASFAKEHQNMFFCYGNHDVSYIWQAMETGYSPMARETVIDGLEQLKVALPPENTAFIHRIDNVIFSHAGLTLFFVEEFFPDVDEDIDSLIWKINLCGKEKMWTDVSPIWARPQDGYMPPFATDYMQVVGHTPVIRPEEKETFLSLDTFSTYPDGRPVGDQRFVWIDTVKKEWHYVEMNQNEFSKRIFLLIQG